MEVTVKNNQSLIDVAIEHLGAAELALDIALLNGISLTDVLEPGTSLLLPDAKPATSSSSVPVVATVSEVSLLGLLTAHTAIMGNYTAGHVRNGGDVTVDDQGRMWVTFPDYVTNWDDIEGKPYSFPPSAHNQDWSTIDDKPASYPPSAHTHSTYHQQIILPLVGWINKQQIATVTGATATNSINVSAEETRANYLAYATAQISCVAQGINSLTFECTTIPTSNITVNIEIK